MTDCVNCGADLEGRVCWTCGHARYTGSETAKIIETHK